MAGVAVECVGRHAPEKDAQHSWLTQRRLLRHLTRSWGFIVDGRLDEDGKHWILHRFGDVCSSQERREEAEKMYLRALQGYEKAWGPDHTSTLDTVNNLGLLYVDLGRLDEAEKMYLRALQGYKKALGQEAVNTYIPALNTAQNMVDLFQQTGRTKEAEGLYEQAVFGVEAVLGHTSNRSYSIAKILDALRSGNEHDI
jgi:tetratricopeptide (TPR) repeat protein